MVRDLSTGGIIRQHRETDYNGNFVVKRSSTKPKTDWPKLETKTAKSAFDENEAYELTALGAQFVHYAMTEITVKLEYRGEDDFEDGSATNSDSSS